MGMESWNLMLSRPPLVSMVHCLVVSGLDIVVVGLVCRGFCGGFDIWLVKVDNGGHTKEYCRAI